MKIILPVKTDRDSHPRFSADMIPLFVRLRVQDLDFGNENLMVRSGNRRRQGYAGQEGDKEPPPEEPA